MGGLLRYRGWSDIKGGGASPQMDLTGFLLGLGWRGRRPGGGQGQSLVEKRAQRFGSSLPGASVSTADLGCVCSLGSSWVGRVWASLKVWQAGGWPAAPVFRGTRRGNPSRP